MPKWFVWHTATQPVPAPSAFSIATSLAHGPTTRPRPLSPSTVAVLADSRTIRGRGRGLIFPIESRS